MDVQTEVSAMQKLNQGSIFWKSLVCNENTIRTLALVLWMYPSGKINITYLFSWGF